jgi:hypothetical protein
MFQSDISMSWERPLSIKMLLVSETQAHNNFLGYKIPVTFLPTTKIRRRFSRSEFMRILNQWDNIE